MDNPGSDKPLINKNVYSRTRDTLTNQENDVNRSNIVQFQQNKGAKKNAMLKQIDETFQANSEINATSERIQMVQSNIQEAMKTKSGAMEEEKPVDNSGSNCKLADNSMGQSAENAQRMK